jgi:hypothetical protein
MNKETLKLTAADLYVIHDVLYKSLGVMGVSRFTKETREMVMNKIMLIAENLNVEDAMNNEAG